jgi:hypothetical protein
MPENDVLRYDLAALYTVFREVVLMGDHNAHHIGEFAICGRPGFGNPWRADNLALTSALRIISR